MANGREERIANLRQQGIGGLEPPVATAAPAAAPQASPAPAPTPVPQASSVDSGQSVRSRLKPFVKGKPVMGPTPPGAVANVYQFKPSVSDEVTREREKYNRDLRRDYGVAQRLATRELQDDAFLQLRLARLGQESQERIQAISSGGQKFSPIATGEGAFVVDRTSGKSERISGPPGVSPEAITSQQEFLSGLFAERGQLLADNPSARTDAIDKRIEIASSRLDRLTGEFGQQPAIEEAPSPQEFLGRSAGTISDPPELISKYRQFEEQLRRPLTEAEKTQIRQRMGL